MNSTRVSSLSVDEPTLATGEPSVPLDSERKQPAEGTQVGRYVVLGRLGAGGMGDVFAAYDPELDRKIALKLVRVDLDAEAENAQARLLREAKALAKLSHHNVVTVFDAGAHEDRVFVAMEFVSGRTLDKWNKENNRSWREILDLALQAGRGLEAAHAVGIIHRDFKPSNVMVSGGDDGEPPRARVLDFGLARGLEADVEAGLSGSGDIDVSEESLRSSGNVSVSLTQTGVVMGTPAYMAPEQFASSTIDERTDQFSFCVVLWRLLYGSRPFAGRKFDELHDAVLRGELQDPGRHATVPARLRSILERGLRRVPGERYPSMTDLLADLQRVTTARKRRALWGSALVGVAIVGGATWAASRGPTPCTGAEAHLTGVWDEGKRVELAESFTGLGKAFADDAWVVVEPRLDEFAAKWTRERTEACAATRVRREQSEHLMDLRMVCLDRQLAEASALVDLFAEADTKVAENAISAVRKLPDPGACADTEALTARVEPPAPEVKEDVEAVYTGLARVKALFVGGKYQESLETSETLLSRALQTGYRPVIARTYLNVGQGRERLADIAGAREAFETAVFEAAASGDVNSQARALTGLCSIDGTHEGNLQGALLHCRHARALLEQEGNPSIEVANIELYVANAYFRARKLDEAQRAYERVLELTDDAPEIQTIRVAAMSNLSGTLAMRGKFRDSLALLQEGGTWIREQWGEHHPSYAFFLNNMGASYLNLQQYEEAKAKLEESIPIYEEAFGVGHFEVGRAYHNLGIAYSALGQRDRALEVYLQALESKRSAFGNDHASVAHTANNIADVLMRLHREEDALVYVDQAIEIWEKTQGSDAPQLLLGMLTKLQVLEAMGRVPSRAFIEKGLTLAEDDNTEPRPRAMFRFVAGKILWKSFGERARARQLVERSRNDFVSSEAPSEDDLAEIDAWLDSHPKG
jgi:tetratricopeptide (TPR) repeat protein/tRNA A-37 threonylcarbamoyl transferase component Bud32